jgi:protein involved in polysaccharide export with SLBB domain/beta-lactamase regulating signal transducer with metallopeptidase domain
MITALAAALVNFVWQGAIIGAAAGALMALARTPRWRYRIGMVGLFSMAIAVGLTFTTAARPAATLTSGEAAEERFIVPAEPLLEAARPHSGEVPREFTLGMWQPPAEVAQGVLVIWAIGVIVLSVRMASGWWGIRRLTAVVDPVSTEIAVLARRIAERLGVRRAVRTVLSARVAVPTVVGALKPIVLLPPAALTGLSVEQVEALLAHELAHVRRHDYLMNLAQSVIETLLFYHPAVWLLSRRVRQERELCCDDLAIEVCGDPVTYAAALADLEALRATPAPALSAKGGSLLSRIRRVLDHDDRRSLGPQWRVVSGIAALAALTLLISAASGWFETVNAQTSFADIDLPAVPQMQTFVAEPAEDRPEVPVTPSAPAARTERVPDTVARPIEVRAVPTDPSHVIRVGDELGLVVSSPFPQPQYSQHTYVVRGDGTIELPSLPTAVRVVGLTMVDANAVVATSLIRARFFTNPIVELSLVAEGPAPQVAVLAPGNGLRLNVIADSPLVRAMNETVYVVTTDGTLPLPNLTAAVPVGGLTMAQAASAIAAAINRDLGVTPTKVEFIGWYRDGSAATGKPVLVGGRVARPGPVGWHPGLTVDEAIAAVGGLDNGDRSGVVVIGADGREVLAPGNVPSGATIYVPPMPPAIEVSVTGAIRRPGRYSVAAASTLAEAIAAAGGLAPHSGARVFVRHGTTETAYRRVDLIDGKLGAVRIQDGDVISVEMAPHFYVNGEVKNSTSEYLWEPGMTLQQAIALAGGPTDKGALNRVTIKRKNPGGKYEDVKLAGDPMKTAIMPEDVITVPKKWM